MSSQYNYMAMQLISLKDRSEYHASAVAFLIHLSFSFTTLFLIKHYEDNMLFTKKLQRLLNTLFFCIIVALINSVKTHIFVDVLSYLTVLATIIAFFGLFIKQASYDENAFYLPVLIIKFLNFLAFLTFFISWMQINY